MIRSFFITCLSILLLVIGSLLACSTQDQSEQLKLADLLEESLFDYIVDPWYPLVIDSMYGGYISEFSRNWSPGTGSGEKAIVQQARHVWATARLFEAYPEKEDYLEYATHGFLFLKDVMWDKEFGGFHAYCTKEGDPVERTINDTRCCVRHSLTYSPQAWRGLPVAEKSHGDWKPPPLWSDYLCLRATTARNHR